MFYQFDDEMLSIDWDEINEKILCLGFINLNELEKCYKRFSFSVSTVEKCKEKIGLFSSDIDVFDDFSFVKLNIVSADQPQTERTCCALYMKKNMMLIVNIYDKAHIIRDNFIRMQSKISCESITLEKLVCAFFEGLIAEDNSTLENSEFKINCLEETVLKNKADRNFNMRLLNMKKELLTLRGYYEQLIDIGDSLRENENEIFDDLSVRQFHVFTNKAARLKENVDLLRDSVVHLWDAYQAYLDMRLNQTMKVFTMVTTIFSPIAVIVGWYGMNFDFMPELHWRYGYIYVMAVSILVVGALFIWFKKKKWF